MMAESRDTTAASVQPYYLGCPAFPLGVRSFRTISNRDWPKQSHAERSIRSDCRTPRHENAQLLPNLGAGFRASPCLWSVSWSSSRIGKAGRSIMPSSSPAPPGMPLGQCARSPKPLSGCPTIVSPPRPPASPSVMLRFKRYGGRQSCKTFPPPAQCPRLEAPQHGYNTRSWGVSRSRTPRPPLLFASMNLTHACSSARRCTSISSCGISSRNLSFWSMAGRV
jgi:hypothetical protein